MMLVRTALALSIVASVPALAAPSPGDLAAAKAAVQQFYDFHLAHDMGFTTANLKARERFLDPELHALLAKKLAEPVPDDEVPDIDGDPFTDAQDTPTSFTVGDAAARGELVDVRVTFRWSETESRELTVALAKGSSGWGISDVLYGEGGGLRKLAAPRKP